jgi:NitT/TauT family transport system substrate-binding protein
MSSKAKHAFVFGLVLSLALGVARSGWAEEPLKIGYSDWPGWVAWEVAINKGWLKEAGINAEFQWFDYSASMDAFGAGKIDADLVTNGDALVMGSGGSKSVMIMLTDYSNGNDMIVGKPGIKSLADLKGKKVGIEIGLVEHLLLLNGLKKAGIPEDAVTLVNTKTNDTPQVLGSGAVDAIGAWQPNSGMAMQQLPGSKPVYTSADEPGLIYDVLVVNPASLKAHRDEWMKVIKLWDRVVHYINDPKTQADAVKIMSARVGLTPEQYTPLLKGTHLIDLAEGKTVFKKGDGFASLYGSSKIANDFNVKAGVYKTPEDIESYIDPSLTDAQETAAAK